MYKLTRKNDELEKLSKDVTYLKFKEDGTFKSNNNFPEVGRSLLMSPFSRYFTWQTTEITEIIEEKEDYLHFKTKNSEYELFKIGKE